MHILKDDEKQEYFNIRVLFAFHNNKNVFYIKVTSNTNRVIVFFYIFVICLIFASIKIVLFDTRFSNDEYLKKTKRKWSESEYEYYVQP